MIIEMLGGESLTQAHMQYCMLTENKKINTLRTTETRLSRRDLQIKLKSLKPIDVYQSLFMLPFLKIRLESVLCSLKKLEFQQLELKDKKTPDVVDGLLMREQSPCNHES